MKYLVCVDNSDHARTSVKLAALMAKKRGAAVDLLHVIEPGDFQGLSSVAEMIREENLASARTLMQELTWMLELDFGLHATHQIREGKLEQQILETTLEDTDIGMILLGASPDTSSNQGNLFGWLAGNLGDKLMVPIVLVPGSLTLQQLEALA
jgi:nucleotide-binding universal stress UspA family protein